MPLQDRTDEIIAYVVHHLKNGVGRTRLFKLIYMIDLEARGWLGKPISTLEYTRYLQGPYDRSFDEHTEHAKAYVEVVPEQVIDYTTYVHKPIGSAPTLSATAAERLVIDRVLALYGKLDRQTLVEDVVYETPPMLQALREKRPLSARLDMESQNFSLKKKYGIDMEQVALSLASIDAGRMADVEQLLKGRA